MSKTEALVDAVERFSSTPRVIKLAFVLINIAYLFLIIGFSTDGWVYISRTGQTSSDRQGLFNHCVDSDIFTCCQSLNSHLSDSNVDGVPAWIDFTRAILGFGLISSTVAMIMMYICSMITVETANSKRILYLERACYVASYFTGGFLLLGAIVYGAKSGKDQWQAGAYLHGSFGITTMAGILFVFAGIATCVPNKRNRVNDQSVEQTNREQQGQPTIPTPHRHPPLRATNGEQQGQPTIPSAPPPPAQASNDCCICLDETVNATFLNCGHASCCINCANNLFNNTKICPICRQTIRKVIRIYRT